MFAFSAVLILVMVTAAVYFIHRAGEDVRAEIQSTMRLMEHVLDIELRESSATGRDDAALRFHLEALQSVRHLRVEFFDAEGRLVETSQPGPGRHQPSVPAWFAALASPASANLVPVRRPVIVKGDPRGMLIITPEPANEFAEKWEDTKELLLVSIVLFIAVNAALYAVVARALRPVDRILAALAELEDGNLGTRLPAFALPEFAKIGARFNRMAEVLQESGQQNRRLTLKLIRAQEDERKRLARELHDELGQCLTAIRADAAAIVRHGKRYPAVRDSAAAIVDVTQRVMASIRGMLHRLRPEALDQLGLADALSELIQDWRRRHPSIACTLVIDSDIDMPGEETAVALYRSVQEALTNVARHSMATRVEIHLRRVGAPGSERLTLSVHDNGRGASRTHSGSGFGLLGIRERALALGGSFAIAHEADAGFRFQLELPLVEREMSA